MGRGPARAYLLRRSEPASGGCREWTGAGTARGHGHLVRVIDGEQRIAPAHALSFAAFNGPVPLGAFVCHRCDNPPCIEPTHLFLSDAAGNVADKVAKGRHVFGQRAWNAKLSPARVRRAFELRATGLRLEEVARRLGCSRGAVHSALRRRTWRHVPIPLDLVLAVEAAGRRSA